MKNISRKDALKLIGLTGIASFSSSLMNKIYGSNLKQNNINSQKSPIINITNLPNTGTWPTKDPFLFCVHHHDVYPSANDSMGPNKSLLDREIGQDFSNKDGWSMYHGQIIPGFPRHPHRGFETVTVVDKGLIDHFDSMGASARYGNGDVQWLTAGNGIQHSEMFPLLNKVNNNSIDFFQIWINLPSFKKRVDPHFSMFWSNTIPIVKIKDANGRTTEIKIVAGKFGDNNQLKPPPDSWASDTNNNIAIWVLKLQPNAEWILPATSSAANRSLYIINGNGIKVGPQFVSARNQIELMPDLHINIKDSGGGSKLLLLQGNPILEPIVKYGPFVMNSQEEIKEAYYDYQQTQFGGWIWDDEGPVHGKEYKRFVRFVDGTMEIPT